MASSVILPHTYVALRIPSGLHKILKIVPDTTISLGKFGSFNTNALLGRPFHLTYEISETTDNKPVSKLRIVPASELHADGLVEEDSTPGESCDELVGGAQDAVSGLDIVGENGKVLIRNNRQTVDDPTRQTLSAEEIEEMKKVNSGSGKEIVARILSAHSALDEKTVFSLAKYTMRKNKKYMKRFTALPLTVSMLTKWMVEEKEPARVMELREECLGLISSWSNVHYGGLDPGMEHLAPNGRWLVVDDTGGLVVAALAEHMGILYAQPNTEEDAEEHLVHEATSNMVELGSQALYTSTRIPNEASEVTSDPIHRPLQPTNFKRKRPRKYPSDGMSATNNTITLIHAATQANISMLHYFSYDPSDTMSKSTAIPATEHPLHTNLKTINFLQLTNPSLDGAYTETEAVTEDTIAAWKSSQRANYYRKRRRWERTKRIVDETRAGGFDGLVVASSMAPASILHHTVPLLRGGAQVVVYSPNVEQLTELADLYSSSRKSAFLNELGEGAEISSLVPSEHFPVDPRLLLAPTLQTARATEWQVLPGRTHPLMTSRGGAEGYLFTAIKVIPAEGRVEARGRFAKKKKVVVNSIEGEGPSLKKVKVDPISDAGQVKTLTIAKVDPDVKMEGE